MKIPRNTLLLLFSLCLALPAAAQEQNAQKKKKKGVIESREQADGWYLPVKGEVTIDGKKANGVSVKVFKENAELGSFPVKKGRFSVELDLDAVYTLYIGKEGYQNKMIVVDANLPRETVQYPAYQCYVKLETEGQALPGDPFFTDFPTAIIRYNKELGGYYHSEAYLEDINNKLHSIAKAGF